MSILERFTDPVISSACNREIDMIFLEFVDEAIDCFHIDTINLVVLDQWRKTTNYAYACAL